MLLGLAPALVHAQSNDPNVPVRFAVIGDFGTFRPSNAAVAAEVGRWNPDFILTVGDNNYPFGEAATIDDNIGQHYHPFIAPYRGRYGPGAESNRFFPTLGNHDWDSMSCSGGVCAGPYLDYFTLPGNERYYELTWGPVDLFILDSDPREPDGITASSAQAAWLSDRMAASDACWKLVSVHHPPYSSGVQNGSTPALRWPYAAWGADAVLTGHEHFYERLERDGIPYFVNGAGGMVLYRFASPPISGSLVRYNERWGAMQVDASCGEITYRFITDLGEVIDTYTVRKPAGLTFGTLDVVQKGPVVEVAWHTRDEINIDDFAVERSLDGGPFEPVATAEPTGGYQIQRTYDLSLPNLPAGQHTYRVRWTGTDGRTDVTPTFTLDVVQSDAAFAGFDAKQLRFDTIRLDWQTTGETLLENLVLEEVLGPDSVRAIETLGPAGTTTIGQDGFYSLIVSNLIERVHTFRVRWTGRDGRTGVSEPFLIGLIGSNAAVETFTAEQLRFDTVRLEWQTAGEILLESLVLEEVFAPDSVRTVETFSPAGTTIVGRDSTYGLTLTELEERRYTFRVRWIGQGGRQDVSDLLSIDVLRAAVQFDAVTARQDLDVLVVGWQTTEEFRIDDFVVERAPPDSPFVAAAVLPARGAPQPYTARLEGLDPGLHQVRIRWRGTDAWSGLQPVESVRMIPMLRLDTLTVRQAGPDVETAWSTSAEYATDRFTLLARSPGATAFEPITEIPAAGTARDPQRYTYRLDEPGVGDYVFRLDWVDTEGRTRSTVEQSLTVRSLATIVDFQTDFVESRVVLTWETRDEVYLDGYVVERQDAPDVFTEVDFITPAEAEPPGPTDSTRTYRYAIERLDNGVYTYRVRWVGQDGRTEPSALRQTEVDHPFTLEAAYPNPFTAQTRIGYSLPQTATVRLEVIDMLGRQVAALDDGERAAGPHVFVVPASGLASGVYVYRLFVDGSVAFRRTFVVQR